MAGQGSPDRRRRNRDAILCESLAQLFHRAHDALLRRLFRHAERYADFAQAAAVHVAQKNRVAIRAAELGKRFIDDRGHLPPGFISGTELLHIERLLFAPLPPEFRTGRPHSDKARGLEQPTRQHRAAAQGSGLAREKDEHGLGHILRQLRVLDLPQRAGVDQPRVPLHERMERRLRFVPRVGLDELPVVHVIHVSIMESPSPGGKGQREEATGESLGVGPFPEVEKLRLKNGRCVRSRQEAALRLTPQGRTVVAGVRFELTTFRL